MKFTTLLAAGLPWVAPLSAGVKSGHASASLLQGADSYQAGRPVPVAIRLAIDPGWHSYWVNPGEGGMPLKALWTLPPGWQAGALRQPVPKRFMTGELPGFGYEGEVLFLTELLPPAGASGMADLKVKLSWLTCDDDSCVPGSAELPLSLPAGDGAAGAGAPRIAAAAAKIPAALDGLVLEVGEKGARLDFSLRGPEGFDPTGCEVFVATPQVVDPAEPPVFRQQAGIWTASARKNEYASAPATLVEVVLAGGKLVRPVTVTWRRAE